MYNRCGGNGGAGNRGVGEVGPGRGPWRTLFGGNPEHMFVLKQCLEEAGKTGELVRSCQSTY